MSGILHPILPMGDGETTASYVSRLARLHRRPSAWQFCSELGLQLRGLAYGSPVDLARLSRLTGIATSAFEANAIRTVGNRLTFRGEELRPYSFTRGYTQVCPLCLEADRRAAPELGDLAPFGRVAWRVACARTCHEHDVRLVPVAFDKTHAKVRNLRHDFQSLIDPTADRISALLPQTHPQTPSPLERYVHDRLMDGSKVGSWLDMVPVYAVLRACISIGTVAMLGRKASYRSLDDHTLASAEQAGFDILVGGRKKFAAFLSGLTDAYYKENKTLNSRHKAYGRVYTWMSTIKSDPGFGAFIEAFRDHLSETALSTRVYTAPGPWTNDPATVLRQGEPKLTAIRSACIEYGLHRKRLRKLLLLHGFIDADHANLPDSRVTFDAAAAAPLLRELADSVPFSQVATQIGARGTDVQRLVEAGWLKPIVGGGRGGPLAKYAFRPDDVAAFQARLFRSDEPDRPCPGEPVSLEAAARSTRCPMTEIVALALARKLKWVGRSSAGLTLDDLLVDLHEVRRHAHRPDSDYLRATTVATGFGIRVPHVRSLVDAGLLSGQTRRNPMTRVTSHMISATSVRRFRETFIHANQISDLARVDAYSVRAFLENSRLVPDLSADAYGRSFYRRDAITPAILAALRAGKGRRSRLPVRTRHQKPRAALAVASAAYALPKARVRAILIAHGFLAADNAQQPHVGATFDAEAAAPVLDAYRGSLTLSQAAAAIGARSATVQALIKAGLLTPRLGGGPGGTAPSYVFRKDDVEAFRTSLFQSAVQYVSCPGRAVPVEAAARATHYQITDIIALILTRRLAWIGRTASAQAIGDLLINLDELKAYAQAWGGDHILAAEVARRLGIRVPHVMKLGELGLLDVRKQVNPATRIASRMVLATSFEEFLKKFAHEKHVAELAGVHTRHVRALIRQEHLLPALAAAEYGRNFYNRSVITGAVIHDLRGRVRDRSRRPRQPP